MIIDQGTVVAFDLSTTLIGVTIAKFDKGRVEQISTLPFAPYSLGATDVGFTTATRKEIVTKGGKLVKAYLWPGETTTTLSEKRKRDTYLRNLNRVNKLQQIGFFIGSFLDKMNEEHQLKLVLMERNSAFNGILTTKQLAEVAGGLHMICGAMGIELLEYDVRVIRSKFKMAKLIKEFAMTLSIYDRRRMKDMDKEAVKWKLLAEYQAFNLNRSMVNDESDALAVFDHWLKLG